MGMKRHDVEKVLLGIGFESILVDENNAKMDVWDLDNADLQSVAKSLQLPGVASPEPTMCSHAKKAAERRAQEKVETYLSCDREAGIHWGNPQFDFVQDFDMNEYCARVVIYAEKPRV